GFDGQDYVEFILDFLKASYKYPRLNNLIQNNIMKRHLVNESNVYKIRNLSHECKADLLKNYCEKYIERNEDILNAIKPTQNIPHNYADTQNIPQNCTDSRD
ncbi:16984_t:CDS:1, partial [Racocetra persica]